MRNRIELRASLLLGLLAVIGCQGGGCASADFSTGGVGQAGPSGDFGATQGGVQDMGLARELIGNGRVPPPEAFLVEGMFSEHDLGLSGQACSQPLCLRGALGLAPDHNARDSGWLQIGLSSTVDLDSYRRPSVTLIATVDVSGSMGWDYVTEANEYPTPGNVARRLLNDLSHQLDRNDRIALVIYSSDVSTPLGLTRGDDRDRIQPAIDALTTGGVTNMEAGLRVAGALAREALDGETDEVHIVLFTDVQPNVGASTPTEFERIAADAADDGIGLSVMALGVGTGQAVLKAMSHIRGANAFSLFEFSDIEELMKDDWPFLIDPLAYDLEVSVAPAGGFEVAETFGFPVGDQPKEPTLDVGTVFLSRRKGALLVRLEPTADTSLADLSVTSEISYQTPAGERLSEQLKVELDGQPRDGDGRFFAQAGVERTVGLALLVSGMRDAAEIYATDTDGAVQIMQNTLQTIAPYSESEASLVPEVDLCTQLLELMKSGAEQGDLYGFGFIP